MKNENRLNIYRQDYQFELQRKDRLTSMVSIPIGIISLLFGATVYFYKAIPNTSGWVGLFLSIAVILMFVMLALATYYLIRSYYPYGYKYVPTSQQIEDYWMELSQYYSEEVDLAADDFVDFLKSYYCEANETNSNNNDIKSGYLHKAITKIVVLLVVACSAAVILHINTVSSTANLVYTKLSTSKVVTNNERQANQARTANPKTVTKTVYESKTSSSSNPHTIRKPSTSKKNTP